MIQDSRGIEEALLNHLGVKRNGYGYFLILDQHPGRRENCNEKMDQFLKRCFYHYGQYDSQQSFVAVDKKLKEHEVIGEAVI
ncbi:hypothetical protein Lal_00011388 [Lupinus albus]|nr:hypothetical protein Lal_00011388 [Lupinus albus]